MKVLFKIIKGIITIFLLAVLILVIFQKFTGNRLTLGNIYVFQVASESMIPEYKIGDVIVVKKTPCEKINVGDDVTYYGSKSDFKDLIITHRVIDKENREGNYHFITKGLANSIEDPEIVCSDIYGKVFYKTVLFSFIGRLMTNITIYYFLCISVFVCFAYEVITSFFIKDNEEDDDDSSDDAEEKKDDDSNK